MNPKKIRESLITGSIYSIESVTSHDSGSFKNDVITLRDRGTANLHHVWACSGK